MGAQVYPFTGPVSTNDVGVNENNPGIQYGGTEPGAIYFEDREIAGTLYRVQNATYNTWASKWLLVNTDLPAVAVSVTATGLQILTSPAGTSPFTSWATSVGYPNGLGTFFVTAYGAKGDGVALDASAIQAATDACHAAGGGIVFYPPGTYRFDKPVKTYSNVKHVGCGPSTVLTPQFFGGTGVVPMSSGFDATSTGEGVLYTHFYNAGWFSAGISDHDVSFENLTFGIQGTTSQVFTIMMRKAQRVRTYRCQFFSCYEGVAHIACDDTQVQDSYGYNVFNASFDHWGGCTNNRVLASRVFATAPASSQYGVLYNTNEYSTSGALSNAGFLVDSFTSENVNCAIYAAPLITVGTGTQSLSNNIVDVKLKNLRIKVPSGAGSAKAIYIAGTDGIDIDGFDIDCLGGTAIPILMLQELTGGSTYGPVNTNVRIRNGFIRNSVSPNSYGSPIALPAATQVDIDDIAFENCSATNAFYLTGQNGAANTVVIGPGVQLGGLTLSGAVAAYNPVNGVSFTAGPGVTDFAAYGLAREGSFFPSLVFGGAAVGMTYGTQSGWYRKVGPWVDVLISITLTAKGTSTGTASISMPFNSDAARNFMHGGTILQMLNGVGITTPAALIANNVAALYAAQNGNASLTDANFGNTTSLVIQLRYKATS